MSVKDKDIITVRFNCCSAYIARCQGKTASSTSCAKVAAEAVAKKVMGARPHSIVRISGDEQWRIVEHSND